MSSPTRQRREPGSSKRRRLIESGPGFRAGLAALPRHLQISTIGAGLVAAIFGCTGPALIIINGAKDAGLSDAVIASWILAVYGFGGLISLVLGLYYKIPVTGAWSIPGAVLVVGALADFEFAEMIGAFIVSGLIVLILGLTGLIRQVAAWLPFPIVMAMIAGALIRFGTGIVDAGMTSPIVVGAAVIGYLLLSRFIKIIPGVIGALVFGIVAVILTDSFNSGDTAFGSIITSPVFTSPEFSLSAMLAVAIPLAILVIGAENAQATGVLAAEKFEPPVNSMTLISGVGGVLAGIFGGHNANIAGPMTAICSSPEAGDRPGRYAATVVNGVLFLLFGLFAGVAVSLVTALPGELIGVVAGLAMIGVLISAFQGAFQGGRFQTGAFAALIIAMSGVTIFNISSPFWALVGGVLISLTLERKDFRANKETVTK